MFYGAISLVATICCVTQAAYQDLASYQGGGVGDLLNKRGSYIIHSPGNGRPRYTSLVRRNFLRFGKRSGAGHILKEEKEEEQEERREEQRKLHNLLQFYSNYGVTPEDFEMPIPSKKAKQRNFIRFGRKKKSLEIPSLEDQEETPTPSEEREKRAQQGIKRRRMSNFLRFGRSSGGGVLEDEGRDLEMYRDDLGGEDAYVECLHRFSVEQCLFLS